MRNAELRALADFLAPPADVAWLARLTGLGLTGFASLAGLAYLALD